MNTISKAAFTALVAILPLLPLSALAEKCPPLLWVALLDGRADLVTVLLAAGEDPDVRTDIEDLEKVARGITPLHWVARTGDTDMFTALIEGGAAVDARASDGLTPLHVAVLFERAGMVRRLLEAGADPDAWSARAVTPLHLAAHKRDPAMIDALLLGGAEPNVQAEDGSTPLHLAIVSGKAEAVRRLLEAGADPNVPNGDGALPLHLAGRGDNTAIADALRRAGATEWSRRCRAVRSGLWSPVLQRTIRNIACHPIVVELISLYIQPASDPGHPRSVQQGAIPPRPHIRSWRQTGAESHDDRGDNCRREPKSSIR